MASATRLPLKSILLATSLVLGVSASRIQLRSAVLNTLTGPGKYSRIAVILVIFANIKNVPFVWHYRVWSAILRHCLFSKPQIPADLATSSLFLPVISSSRSPLYESDYNFHKSNSTYFSDLDVTRSHLVCCLLQPGIERLQHNLRTKLVLDKEGNAVSGRWGIMLGSVMCSFKREIGMYQSYEMWSRVLCWDRKWIYIVTHFVKKGTCKPTAYILNDGSWFGKKGYKKVKGDGRVRDAEFDEKAIFASAVSKYVVKLGRLTVHPEVLLQASGVLPPRPGGWATMSGPSGESTPEIVEVETNGTAEVGEATEDSDWKKVEAENKKGLKFAEHFAAMDALHHEFSGSQGPALGRYTTGLLW
ncbi:Thioesterase ester dehydrase-isomerase [Venustampulla echinocandica]|uniref:Thioesterase ester dehydrase-isomerase n=1 Tax=Venustampulla echinocandica TaxID=2656787 RepID=A0A370TPN9_9HELO|nr:Thioesterase ester dehydrase-isomerase [Venustampulla echinocandica]RDL37485.1 Thioesterase ester dehydrase-isomerase [Venustampulla echinocandica]